MLVVAANWGFTDGTLVRRPAAARAAREWLSRVGRAAIQSGFARDGAYRPPAAVDLVLAGDTFDCLLSAAWCGRDRPWHAGARVAAARRRVLVDCARRAAPLVNGLLRLSKGGLTVPAADRRGRPDLSAVVRVAVRPVLVVGDRDLPLAEVAADVVTRGVAVAPAWGDGVVFVRHGHEFDPACHVESVAAVADRPPTLGESVAVDLVGRFAVELEAAGVPRSLGGSLLEALAAAGVTEVSALVAAWLRADAAAAAERMRCGVESAWRRAVDGWERETRRAPPDVGHAASPIADLAAWFVGADGPPPTLAHLLDRSPRCHGGARTLVLGHAPGSRAEEGVICLGRAAVPRWRPIVVVSADGAASAACVEGSGSDEVPVTIAFQPRDEHPDWRQIAGAQWRDAIPASRLAAFVDAA